MALNYDSPLIDNTTGSPTLDSLKSGSDKINGALTEIKEEVNDLGSASTATVQTSATDDTADRLMAVGAFGLGLPNIIPTGVDLNDYVTQGFYNINDVTGISNLPPGGVGSLVVLNYAAPPTVRTTQNFYSVDGSIYSRSGVGTTWTDWVELYHTGNTGTAATKDTGTLDTEVPLNSDLGSASLVDAIGSGDLYGRDSILGTVSETAGVPTGAIIESGSNSDGYWSQFADGTQIETVFISEELDSSLANKGDVTNFDMDRSAPLSTSWDKASYSCHGRGIGGGGDRSDLALAGRLNENVKVYRPIGLRTTITGDSITTSSYINIDLQLITRWF